MANLIDYRTISGWKTEKLYMTPSDFGYSLVPIYGGHSMTVELGQWIIDNIVDKWTYFAFGGHQTNLGVTYCFESKEDAVAFKLRFV